MTVNETVTIKLDQFLKLVGAVQTGGEAKLIIQTGEVRVNGEIETRRGRKLVTGDRILARGQAFFVDLSEAEL
ncbi:RNA-binding protein [Leptolyngbya sp. 'hensonii']|uniref:RNA-binding S4 domain-containing protein n=1 Tax=Leptolyngbya sp. 'hensonii' TaxID=1922337 RepID=UPI00094F8D91|nr:RNA-binding S4 domain-containing protein [Leptolyngbya sp. 'hensonii']OLP15774.1 RNA-binding protein [Leptolyngbya sp. 'hensonii']